MMQFLKALNNFSTKRVTRLQLPNVTALSKVCKGFDGASSPLEDDQDRIKRILYLIRTGEAALLVHRDIRFITVAIGSTDLIGSGEISGILVEVERRHDHRLLPAVFKALLASYREQRLRSSLRAFLKRHASALHGHIRHFSDQSGILDADDHLEAVAADLSAAKDIYSFCLKKGIGSNILASNYGTELKLAVIRRAVKLGDAKSLRAILGWAFASATGTPIGDYYEAMLSPFEAEVPSLDVQKALMSTLVLKFGDPRIVDWPGLLGNDGEMRREACAAILRRWLSIEYLDLFIKIIEKTAEDRQFRPRKAFWLKYFEKGLISDLTLVLASDANRIARKMRGELNNAEYMKWATLNSALPNQSVLLMRLGDLVIAEWSHSGAMRFWKITDKNVPKFHNDEYFSSALRSGSLKVKVGGNFRDSIIHHDNGQWMAWARNAIEYHTGVRP
ncbi:MAG TPA: EH signature domain-containing protein [Xanthobacteraceae bacterium]